PSTAYVEPYALSKATGAAMIADPEILEQILVKRVGDFPKSEIDDRVLRPAFGDSLLTASGETWRWKRRLVAPAFAPTAMAPLAPVMAAPFERFAEAWASGAVENPVDVALAMREATLAVIAETLFEDPAELDSGAIVQAIEAFLEPISWVVALAALKAPRWTPHPGRGRIRRAAAAMRASVAKTVAHRRGMAAKDDLFGRLMAASDPETGRPLTDEDLVDLILTLVAAGHDTSANTLTWALFLLAEQTDLQAELAAEAAIGSGPADWPKIDAALKETMRLFPAAPMMGRRTTRPERFGTLELAAGTMILIPIYALHRHEALWERPDQFDPARFLGAQPPRTQFMPFGAGPRICVGASFAMQEMALGLAAMLRSARFGVCDETVCDPVHQVTLRPRGPLYLTVRAR
ncbi:MAG: cytochrome P450, partial [Pseudomonadota bacterium]